MSREILFRGYSGNKWVYGYLINKKTIRTFDEDGINPISTYGVLKETIGQYTGLTDKNGTKIFEGDIVEMHYFFENHDPSTLGVFEDEDYVKGCLVYDELGLVLIDKNYEKHRVSDYVQEPCEELEVIGNTFDNPKLLKED